MPLPPMRFWRSKKNTMATEESTGLCTMCNKSNARLCAGCKNARYCSKECQRADSPVHNLLCASFSNFDHFKDAPSPLHFRAIFFPADEEKPKFVWLRCERDEREHGFRHKPALTDEFLGSGCVVGREVLQYNNAQEKVLSDFISLCYRGNSLVDGSMPNRSVASITTTKSGQHTSWRGPILAYGHVGPALSLSDSFCRDLDMNDFRHIVDHFSPPSSEPEPATARTAGTIIKGVRINCIGDQETLKKPVFEAVDIPSTDAVFSEHDTSDIAGRVGIPIFTRRCRPDPVWANDQNNSIRGADSPFKNPNATFLHQCCDPTSPGRSGWGYPPPQWLDCVGSILVVRQDKKPLLPIHMEALCNYSSNKIRPLFWHSNGLYMPKEPMSKEAILATICRATFMLSWWEMLDEKRQRGEACNAPHPITLESD